VDGAYDTEERWLDIEEYQDRLQVCEWNSLKVFEIVARLYHPDTACSHILDFDRGLLAATAFGPARVCDRIWLDVGCPHMHLVSSAPV
jgi:hypothetical protein